MKEVKDGEGSPAKRNENRGVGEKKRRAGEEGKRAKEMRPVIY